MFFESCNFISIAYWLDSGKKRVRDFGEYVLMVADGVDIPGEGMGGGGVGIDI